MAALFILLFFLQKATSTILSDTGCPCATVKNAITTPAAGATISVGCSLKSDWNGQQSAWCLTDQTTPCGTAQTGFGYVDTCALAALSPAIPTTTVFTGQTLNISWTKTNIVEPELIRVGYPAKLLGSANVSKGFFSLLLPDSTTSVTNTILSINTTFPLVSATIPNFTIVQSKIQQAWVYNLGALVPAPTGGGGGGGGGTTTIPCDGRNLTFIWTSIGNAQLGNASVIIKSNGGFGGTTYVGTAVQVPVVNPAGNTTVNYICPRTFTSTGGFTTYVAAITVQSPTTVYTFSSTSFGLSTAPTQTPTSSTTPSQTPTISVTPTPSLSFGATSSITPSGTPTPSQTSTITPSQTPTISVTATTSLSNTNTPSNTPSNTQTPSVTPTPRSILQIGTVTTQIVDTPSIVGSIVGCIGGIVLLFGAVRMYQRRQLTQIRRARLKAASRRAVNDRFSVYGVAPTSTEATIVMHQYAPQSVAARPSSRRHNHLTSQQRG